MLWWVPPAKRSLIESHPPQSRSYSHQAAVVEAFRSLPGTRFIEGLNTSAHKDDKDGRGGVLVLCVRRAEVVVD